MGRSIAEIQQKRAAKVALRPTPPNALAARSDNPLTQQIEVRPIPPSEMEKAEAEGYTPGGSGAPGGKTGDIAAGNPELRNAIHDLVRLGIVRNVEEIRPGLLRLTVGDSFSGSAVEFQLRLLYAPYADSYGDSASLELVRGRVKIGEYTKDGLTLAAN
jgi:hypothetical protein